MFEQNDHPQFPEKEETYSLLSELHNSTSCTQRDLSLKLNVSLGKVNYLIKELIKRGLVSVNSFSKNPNKLKKVRYVLTKKGFNARVELTQYYFKKKEEEYNRMKEEWERLSKSVENTKEKKNA
ncbi:MAG: MarR family EPS-associated transcriptional regulator [Candidatus Omnitrophica bacterium]|nr:MarR family EPS-associated transcriptional regulator [Candidatus Omnitrophota bacterium]